MDELAATRIVDHVRRFADALMAELRALERQLPTAEKEAWQAHFGNALGPLQEHLLIPIEEIFPDVIPVSMGGRGPDRPLGNG